MGRPRRKTCVAVASCAFRRFASCNCCCCSAEDRNSASWSSRHGQRALQKAGKAMGKCGRNIGKSRENIGKWGKHEKIRGKHGNMWENSENIQEKMEKSWNIRKKHGIFQGKPAKSCRRRKQFIGGETWKYNAHVW